MALDYSFLSRQPEEPESTGGLDYSFLAGPTNEVEFEDAVEPRPQPSGNLERATTRLETRGVKAIYGLGEAVARAQPAETPVELAGELAEQAGVEPGKEPGFFEGIGLPSAVVRTIANHVGEMAVKGLVDISEMFGGSREDLIAANEIVRRETSSILGAPEMQYQGNEAQKFGWEVAEATVNMVPALALGWATRNPGMSLGMIGGQVYGDTYSDWMEKTGDPDRAAAAAKFNVMAEVIPETIPVAAILRKTKAGEGLKRMFEATVGEGFQEGITEILQSQYDAVELEGMSLKEALLNIDWSQVGKAALLGFAVGGILATPGAIGDRLAKPDQSDNPPEVFTPSHRAGGGQEVQPVTRGGRIVPDTYITRDGQVIRDTNAIEIEGFDPEYDVGAKVGEIKLEVERGIIGSVMPQQTPADFTEGLEIPPEISGIEPDTAAVVEPETAVEPTQVRTDKKGRVTNVTAEVEETSVEGVDVTTTTYSAHRNGRKLTRGSLNLTPSEFSDQFDLPKETLDLLEGATEVRIFQEKRAGEGRFNSVVKADILTKNGLISFDALEARRKDPAKPDLSQVEPPATRREPPGGPPAAPVAVRYTTESGLGLMNNQALDRDRLTDEEESELVDLMDFGLQQPIDVPADAVFAFTPEGEKQHSRLIELLKKAAIEPVRREEIESTDEPLWVSSDGQIAIKPPQPRAVLPPDQAAAQAATSPENNLPEPTEAQKEAGNYKKGHTRAQGFDITIENPAGSKRRPEWPTLKQHYGYIKRSEGADAEQIDVFVKPETEITDDNPVFVIDQAKADGKTFDEHKVMMGFATEQEARQAYLANYTKDWKGLMNITEVSANTFQAWVEGGDTTQPFDRKAAQTLGFEAEVRRGKERRKKAEKDLLASNAGNRIGVVGKYKDTDQWAAVFKDPAEPGKYRVQNFDARGFSGHQTYNSSEEAMRQMITDGYIVPDPGALDRLSGTEEWAEGMEAVEMIRKFNEQTFRPAEPEPEPEPAPLEPPPMELGKTSKATIISTDQQIEVQLAVVEADNLVASHDLAGNSNPAYPEVLQPRDRAKGSSRLQVQKMANNLKPELLEDNGKANGGAPIIGPDGVVESGNGRTMAILKAYQQNKAGGYRQHLVQNAGSYGLTEAQIKGMKNPVLVRVRQGEMTMDERAEFARQANQSGTAPMTPIENAIADAKRITDDEMQLYMPSENGNILAPSNQQFLEAFGKRLGDLAVGGLSTPDGRWTKQMADRVQAAVFYRAYGDEKLLALVAEEADPDIKNILSALNRAAPAFARARAMKSELGDLDIITDMVGAIDLLRKAKAEGTSVKQMVDQGGLFGDIDPVIGKIAEFLETNARSPKRMGIGFSEMAKFLESELKNLNQDNLFGMTPASKIDIVAAANKRITEEYGDEKGFQDLFTQGEVESGTGVGPAVSGDRGRQSVEEPGAQDRVAEYVYHATFLKHVKGIERRGIKPMQGSNWVKAGDRTRYNPDGGVFAFENPEAALRWAHKMSFDFGEPISIVKARKGDGWVTDPAAESGQFTSRDGAVTRSGAVMPADIIGSLSLEHFKTAPARGLTVDEWLAQSAQELAAIGEPKAPDYTTMAGRDITYQVEVEETGRTYDLSIDAATAMRDIDTRIAALRELRSCI